MKLTHVSVEGCGKFGTLTRIEGLGPGVNILSARNEAGKSTLFRAIRACLFERHSSTNKDISALATDGLSLPVTITVGFEKEGHHYQIRKSFLKSKAASLSCDGVEMARNAEADEEVWKLLGIEARSSRALDGAAYGILWVEQGRSFEVPEPSEGAKSVLNAVIQQEVGVLVGGERARLFLNGVKEDLARYLTDSGRPRVNGPLDAAAKETARLTGERLDVEARLATLNGKIDELARLRADYKAASDPETMRTLRDELKDAQRRLTEAEKSDAELTRLAGDERQAHERAEAQRERLDALKARAAAIDEQRLRLKELGARLAPLNEQEQAATKALQVAAAQKAGLDREAETLDSRESELQRLAALGVKLEQRGKLSQRLMLLEDFGRRAAGNDAALKAASVDEAALKALDAIENEERQIRAGMEAGAARVAIEARHGADVAVNGTAISGNAMRSVTEPLTIAVGTEVAITISPPPATLDTAMKQLAQQREKLQALLSRHGATSAAELRQLRTERLHLEEQARDLRAERTALLLKESLATEIAGLQAAIGEIDAEQRRVLPEGGVPLLAPEEFERQREEITESRNALRATRAAAEAQITAHQATLTSLATTRGTLGGQIAAIHAQLDGDLAVLPDDGREAMTAECANELSTRQTAHRITAAALAEKQAQAPAEGEADRLKARVERLSSAIDEQQKKAARLREGIARLEGEVQISGGDGLGEHAATLKLQHEMALAEEERLGERVEVLKLLRDTVDRCYARRQEELNAPLRRHLKPFLNDVFPQAEIELGESFAVAGLNRSGPGSELFGRLSLGTQEQVAVLVRLAMGAMICERGTDVPIILDDALVFSDDERIEQMFDAINRAGRNQQVIVLTCRSRSFASLGGKQLQII
jgi:DNA repair exonuclease SbcCD ATPase subunit